MKAALTIAAVVIGRNEGARLAACLRSGLAQVDRVIYVDSGSTDGSLALASDLGVEVISLDSSTPFTAARGRNAGFFHWHNQPDPPDLVQFLDGDCLLVDGWLTAGAAALQADAGLGLVTGWRAEIDPSRSIYNALCDFEWHRPAGLIEACGGDMLVRSTAFAKTGGFNPDVIAAEDDEFCVRLRKSGWQLRRIPVEMSHHDAAMTRFSAWWQRAVRSGHGFAQVGHLHPEYFRAERRRVLLFGLILPMLFVLGILLSCLLSALILGLYGLSYLRTVLGLKTAGLPLPKALHHSFFLSLSKFPNMIGMITYWWRRLSRQNMNIIEYK
jgi:GT2 family glycosyltransferase